MINGATEIIAGVPGKNLDPLLLAQSQTTDSGNLMVITYEMQSHLTTEKYFDLLFLHGSRIYDCARMNDELRFRLQVDKVIATFKSYSGDDGTRIHLYNVPQDSIEQFRSTFYYEPCLNIKLESLTRKQIQKLLSNTNCQHGIIEHNDFSGKIPKILLQTIHSSSELSNLIPNPLKGRLLLYDINRNNEFLHERFDTNTNDFPLQLTSPPRQSDTVIIRKCESGDALDRQSALLNEANQITELIKQILDTPSPDQESENARRIESPKEECTVGAVQNRSPIEIGTRTKELKRTKRPPHRSTRKSINEPESTISEQDIQQCPDLVRLFGGVLRSSRKFIFELLGAKCDTIVSEAEGQIRLKHPDFKSSELTETNAIVVLDLLEIVIKDIPLFKRSRVRNAVMQLVADAYNKQYELLERTKVLERTEQFYYELKR